jgi:hypothetical protein
VTDDAADPGIIPGGIRDRAMRLARARCDIEPEEWCRRRNEWERIQRELAAERRRLAKAA